MSDLEKRITAKMVLDDTGYNTSIKGINSSLKEVQSEFKLASEGLKTFGNTSDKIKSAQDALAKQLDLQSKKVDTYREAMEKASQKMNENVTERDKLKTALDIEKAKLDSAIQLYGKESQVVTELKGKIDLLTQEYNKADKAVESNAKQVQSYQTNMNKASTEMVKTQAELNKINTELDKSNNKWIASGKSLESTSKSLNTVGSGLSSAGGKVLTFTAPLIAGLGVATKEATSFEHQMADISKEIEAKGEDVGSTMSKMSDKSMQWSQDFGQSTDKINEGLLTLVKDGYSGAESIDIMDTSLYTARGANEDLATVVDQLGSSLEAYGMKTENATTTTANMAKMADSFAYISNHTKASITSLGEGFSIVGATANALKQPMTQVAGAIGILQSNGIEASTAATSLQAGLVNLTKPTTKMQKALDQMKFSAFDSSGQMKDLATIITEMESKMTGWTDKQKEAALATIFGKESLASWGVLMHKGGDYLKDLSTNADNATGEVKHLSDSMKDTPANKFKELEESVHSLGVAFGKDVLPTITPLINETTELVKWFGSLDDGTKKAIISVTGISLALGGTLKVVGGVIGGIGSVVGAVGKLSTAFGTATVATESVAEAGAVAGGIGGATGLGALATGLGGAVVAAAPFIAVAGAVALAGYGIYKGMTQEVVPSVDLFADKVETTSETVQTEYGAMTTNVVTGTTKISDATKQAVQGYFDMDQDAKKYLQDLYINNQTITGQIVTDSKTKFDNMTQNVVQGYEKQKNDSITKLQELFTKQKDLTSQEQADIIQKTTTYYTNQETQTQTYEDKINQIIQNAANNNRTLTGQEVNDIGQLQNQMRDNAVKSLSDQEVEADVILQRMKDYDGRVTAEQASQHIQELNKSRDGAVQAANDEYDKNIATITKMRDETGSITSEQADKMIEDAKRQRDETVQAAEDTRSQAIDKIKDMDSNLESEVDTSTGNIKTYWDRLKDWWNSWIPAAKTFAYNLTGNASNLDASDGDQLTFGQHWTGGVMESSGYTTLHEKGYELYDLPSGTRIYNHDASEDLVKKTALTVASQVGNNSSGLDTKSLLNKLDEVIYAVNNGLSIDGKSLVKATAKDMSVQLNTLTKRSNLIGGTS
ncbi:phage tail tape measure protein [Clostridium sp. BL-8]|uniref:phage tail tape measure protein n=1 Tax=Clostridium sp. BL-8 TaxID=349938 RepID=UPI00098CAFC0|nr:phage tail tape measure protein [Clostridium sp. BL-8]OOM76574.1 chromosome partition protein Smc [Clostridium sp. BL-8]